jgi:DnaK suppressor protein
VGEFEQRLRRERAQVWRALETTDTELEGLERHEPGDLADDAATDATRTLLARIEARDRQVLGDIAAAQARLSEGTFGVCEGCGQPIPFARLRALPATRRCLACEEATEAAGAAR